MDAEIHRPFLDWNVDAVCLWLSSLSLSNDYSNAFRNRLITGSTLVGLDREELEEMGIIDGADRLKILQQITSMKADLVTSGKASPTKRHRHNRSVVSTIGGLRRASNEGRWVHPRENGFRGGMDRSMNPSPTKYVNVLIQDSNPRTPDSVSVSIADSQGCLSADSQGCLSTDQTSSDSRGSSRMSSPDKLQHGGTPATASSHSIASAGSSSDLSRLSKLQSMATLRFHNVKRLSRSLNNLFQEGEDIFSLYQKSMEGEEGDLYPTSNRLVEILREENSSLKQELETYYRRVRKLQKIEQEVEHIREAHRLMEAGTVRRGRLEKALRSKLEEEVRRLKEETISLKAEIRVARKDSSGSAPDEQRAAPKREIRRRDTMIMRLIKQNKDAALVREQLEKDLQVAKAQLQQQMQENRRISNRSGESASSPITGDPETESRIAQVYSESIEKLRGVLTAMQNMSQKREGLEKKLRSQLEGEIRRLKKNLPVRNKEDGDLTEALTNLQIEKTSLAADCVKWEQKCLELIAEKQMAFETAVIPRDARIASLERSLAEKIDTLHDVQRQKAAYVTQLSDAKRQISELEIRLTSARSSLQEKDSVIQMMQSSFLEPDDEKVSLTPPQNGAFPKGNYRNHDQVPCQITEVVSQPPAVPAKKHRASTGSSTLHETGSRSPRSLTRQPPVVSPVHNNLAKNRSQSASPVKALVNNNVRPRGTTLISNGFSSREPAAPNRRNGYTTHSLCSGNRFATPSLSSTPSSTPNIRGSPHHKPRITHSNLRLLQVPGSTVDRSGQMAHKQNHAYAQRKSNTGPSNMRRSNYQRPPSPRLVKSKTPPPDYHLVSSGRRNSGPKGTPTKQRHRSVDDILSGTGKSHLQAGNGHGPLHDSSYDFFHSLVGDTVPLSSSRGGMRAGFTSSTQLGGISDSSMDYLDKHHQHSSSSPSHEYPCILAPS